LRTEYQVFVEMAALSGRNGLAESLQAEMKPQRTRRWFRLAAQDIVAPLCAKRGIGHTRYCTEGERMGESRMNGAKLE
jgi:hypothetical protein